MKIALGLALLLTTLPMVQANAAATDDEKKALAVLVRVVGHTQRLIDAKNFDRLPHENGEFKEGAEALEKSLGGDAPLHAKVEPLLRTAVAASQKLADAAPGHDASNLETIHAEFDAAVKRVVAAFPADVQPQG